MHKRAGELSKPRRFSVCAGIAGHEVIDHDGRPLAVEEFQHEADGIAATLNKAASYGSASLVRAISELSA